MECVEYVWGHGFTSGVMGDKGEMGPQGDRGENGTKGDIEIEGDKGEKGKRRICGECTYIV